MSSGDLTLGVSEQCQLLEQILQRLLSKETIAVPQQCDKHEIKAHLEKLKQYFQVSGISKDETKIIILFNSLADEIRFELCGQLDFKEHENDYQWIEKKLLELFHPKESEITPLVKLFACKQRPDQHVREFLSEIRIEGYRLLRDMSPSEREKHLINAFSKGLLNEGLQSALSRMEISTLDEAYNLVKKEKNANKDISYVRKAECGNQQVSAIEKLQNQMNMIQKQLSYIVTILQNTSKPSYAEVIKRSNNDGKDRFIRNGEQRNNTFQQQEVHCWTCGGRGHISRVCEQNKCTICGLVGHTSSRCRANGYRNAYKSKRFRQMRINENTDWNSCDFSDNLSESSHERSSDAERKHHEQDVSAEVHAMTIHPKGKPRRHSNLNITTKDKRKQYPKDINDFYEYIQGRKAWKNIRFNQTDTLITKGNNEKAKNKPIIMGSCEGSPAKLFLDTGAEINVVDKEFVKKIGIHPNRIIKARKYIKCANDSKMDTNGWVNLKVRVADKERYCKFWIVERLFPKVIIGIRAMKDLRMEVDPARNCAWVRNVKIPFLSHVQTQSICGRSEN